MKIVGQGPATSRLSSLLQTYSDNDARLLKTPAATVTNSNNKNIIGAGVVGSAGQGRGGTQIFTPIQEPFSNISTLIVND